MDFNDRILFEEFFYMINHNKSYRKNYFDLFINIVLNSKEFLDSDVKLSDRVQESTLLSLSVSQKKGTDSHFSFYATYSVSDGEIVENRDINGLISIKNGKIYLVSEIHRYCSDDLKDYELGEIFIVYDNFYSRLSSYNINDSIDVVNLSEEEFDKVNQFKEDVLNRIKKR